jgi:hypothetical protein
MPGNITNGTNRHQHERCLQRPQHINTRSLMPGTSHPRPGPYLIRDRDGRALHHTQYEACRVPAHQHTQFDAWEHHERDQQTSARAMPAAAPAHQHTQFDAWVLPSATRPVRGTDENFSTRSLKPAVVPAHQHTQFDAWEHPERNQQNISTRGVMPAAAPEHQHTQFDAWFLPSATLLVDIM